MRINWADPAIYPGIKNNPGFAHEGGDAYCIFSPHAANMTPNSWRMLLIFLPSGVRCEK
ncbi:MAG: hypothetical protein M1365_17475 [Actinobacteria bacterium]|nr:hypothetical protein [Actinomycetota bacterium]